MKFRDTWHVDSEGDKVCIWCERFASLCVIEDPCVGRDQYEAAQRLDDPILSAPRAHGPDA